MIKLYVAMEMGRIGYLEDERNLVAWANNLKQPQNKMQKVASTRTPPHLIAHLQHFVHLLHSHPIPLGHPVPRHTVHTRIEVGDRLLVLDGVLEHGVGGVPASSDVERGFGGIEVGEGTGGCVCTLSLRRGP